MKMNIKAAPAFTSHAFHPKATLRLFDSSEFSELIAQGKCCLDLAGLLAFPPFEIPSHPFLGQWMKLFKSSPQRRRDYSYGDSSGFSRLTGTTGFPFHAGVYRLQPDQ